MATPNDPPADLDPGHVLDQADWDAVTSEREQLEQIRAAIAAVPFDDQEPDDAR